MSSRSSAPSPQSSQNGSSLASANQSRRTAPASSSNASHVETSVTKLLVTTKQLLESLTLWSEGRASPEQVSDHFVATGNYFNVAVTAFSKEGISMAELMSVPDDLRFCLEEALSQEPSPRALERYLPRVREIIINLLSGLKAKQTTFRSRREIHSSPRMEAPLPPTPGSAPSQPRAGSPQQGRVTPVDQSRSSTTRSSQRETLDSSRLAQSPPPRPASRETSKMRASGSGEHGVSMQRQSSGGRSKGDIPSVPRLPQSPAMLPQSGSASSLQSRSATPPPPNRVLSPPPQVPEISADLMLPYIQQEAFDPFSKESPDRSFEKLSASRALERRASKRYSAYTYSKITSAATMNAPMGSPATTPEPSAGREFVQYARKPKAESRDLGRSALRGPSLDSTSTPTRHPTPIRPTQLATMQEDEDEEAEQLSPPRERNVGSGNVAAGGNTAPVLNASIPPTPTAPVYPMTVFLQLGRDMKKAGLEDMPSLATLRILFTERFQYNPGMSDFPLIYIRDPRDQHGVQYELEDMGDIRESCILSLNVEPLDAVKEQIANGLAALQSDLKASLSTSVATLQQELKDLAAQQKTLSSSMSPLPGSVISLPGSPNLPRPSEQQFQAAAQKMAKSSTSPSLSQSFGADPRVSRIVSDLKTHYDEVQGVRREIGTLRQVIKDFGTETKTTIGNLRSQAAQVKHVASSKIGAERAAIRAGKEHFEKRMDDLIPRLEELQDTVDDLRNDVTSRGVRPRQQQMSDIKTRLDALSAEIEGATQQLNTLGPAWKHGWEQELEVIIREQEFLRQQEPLLRDAAADLITLSQVYQTIVQYASAVGGSAEADGPSARRRPKVAMAPEEPGDHATVMASVRALAPDPQRRLRAIEQAEKARENELANRSDAFKDELGGFVDGKKLRKTGGTEEADRVREVKSNATLRAMMTPNGLPLS